VGVNKPLTSSSPRPSAEAPGLRKSPLAETFDSEIEAQGQPVTHHGSKSRTTASEGHPCRQCGKALTGRKQRFCNDRCRMKARRGRQQVRVTELLTAIERSVAALRAELEGPKAGRTRIVPLTRRLADALRRARHLRSTRVLCDAEGKPLTQKMVQVTMRRIARKANVKAGVHVLRHSFCSHLAMRGVPARSIQELAGHEDLTTTQRYMHLSPAAIDDAIRVLEMPRTLVRRGAQGEAESSDVVNSSQ